MVALVGSALVSSALVSSALVGSALVVALIVLGFIMSLAGAVASATTSCLSLSAAIVHSYIFIKENN
jgi:hypothetical protein